MTKKISTLALALIMTFALGSQIFAADFNDLTPDTSLSIARVDSNNAGTLNNNGTGTGVDGNLNRTNRNVPGTTQGNTFNRMNTNNLYNNDGLDGVNDGTRYGTRGLMTNNLRARAVGNNGTNWGWLGILGLIGLAGMAGRNRVPDRDR